jgi:hypothetical protein
MAGGPQYEDNLALTVGQDESYGPYGWGTSDVVDPFAQYQAQTYTTLAGSTAYWVVRATNSPLSGAIFSLPSSGGVITFSAVGGEEGPPAPAFNNAFSWTVTNAATSALAPYIGLVLYHAMWLTSGGGLRSLYVHGYLTIGGSP